MEKSIFIFRWYYFISREAKQESVEKLIQVIRELNKVGDYKSVFQAIVLLCRERSCLEDAVEERTF